MLSEKNTDKNINPLGKFLMYAGTASLILFSVIFLLPKSYASGGDNSMADYEKQSVEKHMNQYNMAKSAGDTYQMCMAAIQTSKDLLSLQDKRYGDWRGKVKKDCPDSLQKL